MKAKSITALLLKIAVVPATRLQKFRRAWAFAQLQSRTIRPLDTSVVVLGTIEIHGTSQIALGKNCYLYRDLYLETQEQGEIQIGHDVVISRGVHLVSFERIEIGDGTMIGEYTSIRDANHRVVRNQPVRKSGHKATPIVIGKNVWIGRGVCILPGVHIGDNAVIGANAVVTRNVQAGAVVGGVPARALHAEVTQ